MDVRARIFAPDSRFEAVDSRLLATLLDQGLSLEQIGRRVGRHASTVAYWLRKHGLEPAHARKHRARGGIGRETLAELVESGASIAEIAEQLDLSAGTVRHWLRRHGLRTWQAAARRSREVRTAGRPATVTMECDRHGLSTFRLETRGVYRCLRCRSSYVASRRRRIKSILVSEAGGRCMLCGYDRFLGALHFHHLDPERKLFSLSGRGLTRSLESARAEARKCALLCSNCHAEVEAGLARPPGRYRVGARSDGIG